ncbi:conserved protein of unknown function [Pseudodesulfovibrio profundus]|uniref:Uncharacterized protein n=1 Tax=Pseudodesulfovibrio profundus TaxID=57320 RepID=A0A2C8F8P5_9BACT|nr:conserved protein of unknown function [Pseudodesulfovibrio profundus]
MRIKVSELGLGLALIAAGIFGLLNGTMHHYDVPIIYPTFFAWVLILAGIAIPTLAWILRSPSRNRKE